MAGTNGNATDRYFGNNGNSNGSSKFPNPFYDVASEFIPTDINNVLEWCTPAGTLVELDVYGNTASVEDLKEGDYVLTKSGTTDVIDKVSKRLINETIMNIQVTGIGKGNSLKITKEHPILVYKNPNSTNKASRVDFEDAYNALSYVPAAEVTVGDWVFNPARTYEPTTDFPYDPFLIGLYLAEGCLQKAYLLDGKLRVRGVKFTLGSHEVDLINYTVEVLKEYFGDNVTTYTDMGGRSDITDIKVYDPEFAEYLQYNFGEYSSKKKLSSSVFGLDVESKKRLLGAWIDGDGSISKVQGTEETKGMMIYSCSRKLMYQAKRLAESIGITPSWDYRVREGKSGGFNTTNSNESSLRFTKAALIQLKSHVRKLSCTDNPEDTNATSRVVSTTTGTFHKVTHVTEELFNDYVYNIRVANEHNYIANGIVVHNCEYTWMTFGTWRSASKRVARYFLTDLVLEGESEQEREDYRDFLDNNLHIMSELGQIGDEYMTYGNVFLSVYFPFDRFFLCPGCKLQVKSDKLRYKYKASSGHFIATCHKCGFNGPWAHEDRRSSDRNRVKIIRWNPKQIRLRVHPVSGKTTYFWQIPKDFIKKIEEGKHFYVNDTPWHILKAIQQGSGVDQGPLFEFSEGSLYHFKENTLAGLPIIGWGIPSIIPNFKLVYYIQVLRRFDEAIAHDFIVPFRVLYPDAGPSPAQDPLTKMSLSGFVSKLDALKKAHRADPTSIAVAPFKVGYQMLGGEGKALTPKDQIMQALDELLNSLGYPAELYRGSLSIQAAPIALRLFEKTWGSLVDGYNDVLRWLLDKISKHYMWGDITGKLQAVTLADDMERKALNLQAAAGMDVSKGTAYRPFGIDYMVEQERIVQEQQAIQKLQQEAMEEAQAQQGMDGGSGGGGPGGEVGATPGDIHEQAKQLAQQLLFQTPETQRRSELIKVKQSNPTLHALVIQEMDAVRQQAATQGQSMVMEQQKQQMGSAGGGMVAQASVFGGKYDVNAIASVFSMDSLTADAVLSYNRSDWQKLARAIKDPSNTKAIEYKAFSYAYRKLRGWD